MNNETNIFIELSSKQKNIVLFSPFEKRVFEKRNNKLDHQK